ncbi:hypothetical protein EBZ80_06510 [bacterium]|nr:hypothetical protein [bacterium]
MSFPERNASSGDEPKKKEGKNGAENIWIYFFFSSYVVDIKMRPSRFRMPYRTTRKQQNLWLKNLFVKENDRYHVHE